MSEQVLVTGATGFTGRALCKKLIANGEDVVVFARAESRADDLAEMGAEVVRLDIADPKQVDEHFRPFRVVYHVAAIFRSEHDDIDEFRKINVEATRCLLDAAVKHQCGRFVHFSTVGVQGAIDDPPADEDYRMGPGDYYQQSKLEGEILAREYFAKGLPGTVVRPVGIYGPGDMRFLKLFKPISRKRFVMIGDGKVLYHLTYIDDLIQGSILAGERPEAVGEVFTIGGERYTTLNELVKVIADCTSGGTLPFRVPYCLVYAAAKVCVALSKVLGISPFLYPRRVEFFKKSRAFNIDKAKRLLGYKPSVDLETGIRRTADWYKEQGLI